MVHLAPARLGLRLTQPIVLLIALQSTIARHGANGHRRGLVEPIDVENEQKVSQLVREEERAPQRDTKERPRYRTRNDLERTSSDLAMVGCPRGHRTSSASGEPDGSVQGTKIPPYRATQLKSVRNGDPPWGRSRASMHEWYQTRRRGEEQRANQMTRTASHCRLFAASGG